MTDLSYKELDKETIAKAYARWAPVYDLVFGAVFERGRQAAIEAAERIHQALLFRLLPGPHATLRDGIDLLGRRVPRCRCFLDELVVERVKLLFELLDFAGVVRPHRRVDLCVLADARGLDVRAELLVHAPGHNLPTKDADGTRERRRLRERVVREDERRRDERHSPRQRHQKHSVTHKRQ